MLTGKVRTSSVSRLKHHYGCDNTIDEETDDTEDQVKAKAWKLVDLLNTDLKKFEDMRQHPDSEIFDTFVDYCLNAFVSSQKWRYKAYNTLLSRIFTPSDEAMAMLLLENNARDLTVTYEQKARVSRVNSHTKFTKPERATKERFQGWSKVGIQRYNELHGIVVQNRATTLSRDKEEALLKKYSKVIGKDAVGNNDDVDGDENSNNEESLEEDEVYAIDGFALEDEQNGGMPLLSGMEQDDTDYSSSGLSVGQRSQV